MDFNRMKSLLPALFSALLLFPACDRKSDDPADDFPIVVKHNGVENVQPIVVYLANGVDSSVVIDGTGLSILDNRVFDVIGDSIISQIEFTSPETAVVTLWGGTQSARVEKDGDNFRIFLLDYIKPPVNVISGKGDYHDLALHCRAYAIHYADPMFPNVPDFFRDWFRDFNVENEAFFTFPGDTLAILDYDIRMK